MFLNAFANTFFIILALIEEKICKLRLRQPKMAQKVSFYFSRLPSVLGKIFEIHALKAQRRFPK